MNNRVNIPPAEGCTHEWVNTGVRTQFGAKRRCVSCGEALPSPGSDAAVKEGCRCPRLDNAYGRGYLSIPGFFVFREDCPLHGEGGEPAEVVD